MDDPRTVELLERIVDQLARVNDTLAQLQDQTFTTQLDVGTIKDGLDRIDTIASSIDGHVHLIEIYVGP